MSNQHKFPLLEQLRNDYMKRDATVQAPVYEKLSYALNVVSRLEKSIANINRAVGHKLFDLLLKECAYNLSSKVIKVVLEAIGKTKGLHDPISVILSSDIKFSSPDTWEGRILRDYIKTATEYVGVENYPDYQKKVEKVRIEIPNIGIERFMTMENR